MVETVFYPFVLYMVSALFSIGVTTAFYLRARKSDILPIFLNVQYLVIMWLITSGLRIVSGDMELALFWTVIQYISVCLFGATFLDFAYVYNEGHRMPKPFRWFCYGVSMFSYLVFLTNDFHHLFLVSFDAMGSVKGPYYYLHAVWSHLLIVVGYMLLVKALWRESYKMNHWQIGVFSVALMTPVLTNIAISLGWLVLPFNLAPFTFNLAILVFGYTAYRYRFLDIKWVTQNTVMNNIPEGIIILDADNKIILANPVIQRYVSNYEAIKDVSDFFDFIERIENPIERSTIIFSKMRDCIQADDYRHQDEFNMFAHGQVRNYILKMERLEDGEGNRIGYLVRLVDITKKKELLIDLEDKNQALAEINRELTKNISATKNLAKAKERSRISKEIHDILGHTMTVVIALLEIAKSSLEEEPALAKEKTVQSMEIMRSGLGELKEAMRRNDNGVVAASVLGDDLRKLIEDFEKSGVKVGYYLNPSEAKLSADVYDAVYRSCQEGLTNALRHGKAKNITIALRYVDKHIDLFIVDDGLGCGQVVKGNGLKGMENRVSSLSGYFSCGSPEGDGFNIHITLPYMERYGTA